VDRNRAVMGALVGLVIGMAGLSFAAVPLYRVFCQTTGFGGTTQRSVKAADRVLNRVIEIRFNADVNSGLGWTFRPNQRSLQLKIGETGLATFHAQNLTAAPVTGTAIYNVTPEKAGKYFVKMQCFCFTEQTLKPGESAELPVAFYVDPSIAEDRDLDDVDVITLSYTFFRAQSQAVNAAVDAEVKAAAERTDPAAKSPATARSDSAALAVPRRVE
jgi:cytochrome c oxidase assembly protein subunit 11